MLTREVFVNPKPEKARFKNPSKKTLVFPPPNIFTGKPKFYPLGILPLKTPIICKPC